jgi:hypothetical protein
MDTLNGKLIFKNYSSPLKLQSPHKNPKQANASLGKEKKSLY